MSFILTKEQLRELTGRKHLALQREELMHMGVPFRVRSDGSIVVLVADLSAEARTIVAVEDEPELTPP